MRDVRVDQHGDLHCWNCLSTNFERKRTVRSKLMSAVGGRASNKKLKCRVCGQYNDVGHEKQIDVPDTPAPAPLHPRSAAEPLDRLSQRGERRASPGRDHR
jgi:hypothetical protein